MPGLQAYAHCSGNRTTRQRHVTRVNNSSRSICVSVKLGGRANCTGEAEPVTAGLSQPRWEVQTPLGRLLIRPIERSEDQAASVVLTRAFASSAEAVALNDVLTEIKGMLPSEQSASEATPASGYFLIARLFPDDPSQAPLPPGQDSRLVGTATLSLSADSPPVRRLPRVNLPPQEAAYISNMAVDPRVRRRGIARALLAACEDAALRAGRREVWLHVREPDAAARALYDSTGYVVVGKDSWLDKLKHDIRAPRILMRREL